MLADGLQVSLVDELLLVGEKIHVGLVGFQTFVFVVDGEHHVALLEGQLVDVLDLHDAHLDGRPQLDDFLLTFIADVNTFGDHCVQILQALLDHIF